MDFSLPGSSVHGILQARIVEWVAIPFSTGSVLKENSYLLFNFILLSFNISHFDKYWSINIYKQMSM